MERAELDISGIGVMPPKNCWRSMMIGDDDLADAIELDLGYREKTSRLSRLEILWRHVI
jgi:hypothetical protein